MVAFDAGEGMLLRQTSWTTTPWNSSPAPVTCPPTSWLSSCPKEGNNEDGDIMESRRADGADRTVDLDPELGLVTLAAIRPSARESRRFHRGAETFQWNTGPGGRVCELRATLNGIPDRWRGNKFSAPYTCARS